MIECKCKNCTERHIGCHSTCEDYKNFRNELDKMNEGIGVDREFNTYARCERDMRYINLEKNRRK